MQVPEGVEPQYGGRSADCPPPNPRIAAWWRELNEVGTILEEFDLSLETTHHGPWIETPSSSSKLALLQKHGGIKRPLNFLLE